MELLKLGSKKTAQFKKQAKDVRRHLSKEDIPLANKHIERCSASFGCMGKSKSKPQDIHPPGRLSHR